MKNMLDVKQVSPAYRHYEKKVYGHGVIKSTHSRLKWYDIARGKKPIPKDIRDLATDYLSRQTEMTGTPSSQELGFVLLHRCGAGFYFLGLCTWRENNELWKTVFYFDTKKMEDFALFPQDGAHRDTFCVWELSVVGYETLAWTTYLRSGRTNKDAETYVMALL